MKKQKGRDVNKYILLSDVQERNAEMSDLLSAARRNCLQLVQPWRAAAAPRSAVHVLEMTGCISRPKCALPPGLIEDWVGKTDKKEEEGGGQLGFRMSDTTRLCLEK